MSFSKRLIQVITLSVFFFLMAGFVAYRSGKIPSILSSSDPESTILEKVIASRGYVNLTEEEKASLEKSYWAYFEATAAESEASMSFQGPDTYDLMSSSKSGSIFSSSEWFFFSPFPYPHLQDTTKKKKKTKNLGITVDPAITDFNTPADSIRMMSHDDSVAMYKKAMMGSSKSMLVVPPSTKPAKKKKH
jgi:hypothetical protein